MSKAKKKAAPASNSRMVGIVDHPRAAAGIARAKALGGLGGFVLIGLASLVHGEPALGSLVRATVAGIACYVASWAAAVAVWRQLLVAEARGAHRRRVAERDRAGSA
jgi:hypothetical protein